MRTVNRSIKIFLRALPVVIAVVIAMPVVRAQETAKDRSAKPFIEVAASGVITADGEKIGKIDRGGTVYKRGEIVGKIGKDGMFRAANGDSLGAVDGEGNVLDHGRVQIGTVEKDGTLRDGKGLRIGGAPGVNKRWAAAVFFFF